MAFDIPGITFLEKHEKLLIVIAILVFGVFAFYKGDSMLQKYQEGKLTKMEQELAQTKAESAQAKQDAADAKAQVVVQAQAAAQDKAAAAAIISAVTAQNAALNRAMVDRGKQTQQQQQVDLSSNLPELSKRFLALVPLVNPQGITVAPDEKSVTFDKDSAQKTAAQLELVPQLQQDKKDLQTEVDNSQKEVTGLQKALDTESRLADLQDRNLATEEKYAALLQTTIDQGDKVCQQKIDIEKTKGRKSFLKGVVWGGITGFLGGLFVGHGI